MTITSEMVGVVVELLTEFGVSATVSSSSGAVYNPSTLTTTTPVVDRPAIIAFFDPANSNMSGYEQNTNDTASNHKWMYVRCDTPVQVGDRITVSGNYYLVENQSSIGPTGEVIYQRVRTSQTS